MSLPTPVGRVGAATLHRMADGSYLARIPTGGGGYESTHDVHARVRIGKYESDSDALAALARALERRRS